MKDNLRLNKNLIKIDREHEDNGQIFKIKILELKLKQKKSIEES